MREEITHLSLHFPKDVTYLSGCIHDLPVSRNSQLVFQKRMYKSGYRTYMRLFETVKWIQDDGDVYCQRSSAQIETYSKAMSTGPNGKARGG